VAHGIAALGDRDILVNILLKREALSPSFLNRLGKGGIVQGFLSRVLLEHQRHDRYLVFRCGDQDRLQQLVRNLLCEFFGGDDYTGDALNHYVPLLLIELMRVYRLDAHEDSGLADEGADLLEMLGYIEKHFRRCTLGELARRFHFNPNYLGNLLKDRTGFTFTELVQKQRLNRAALLLRTTERSIGEIAADCGYESPGYFHRLFKSRYGTTPSRYRRNPPNAKSRNDP
jgi:AraC-like DNA-binding protein